MKKSQLTLNRETIRNLTTEEIKQAAGGTVPITKEGCWTEVGCTRA